MLSSQLTSILEDRRLIALINEIAPPGGLIATQGDQGVAPFCPIVGQDGIRIEWEIRYASTGLLKAQHRDADIPLDKVPGIARVELDTPVWRTKYLLRESDLMELRIPGQREGRYGMRLLSDCAQYIASKTDLTIELSAWQALSGTLTIQYPDANNVSVNYRMPAFLAPTASPLWSDLVNADPLSDIQTWIRLLADVGISAARFVFSPQVEEYLMQNSTIRTLIQATYGERLLSTGRLPQNILGVPHTVYDKTYLERAFVGTAYTSGTSLVLDDAGELANLSSTDNIVCGPSTTSGYERAIERVGVTSITGNTITIDGAMTNDFSVGDPVTWYRKFLPNNIFVILPQPDGQRWMEWLMCPSPFGNNMPQKYTQTEKLPGSPLKYEVMGGVDGLPVIYRQMRHVYATVG